MLLLPFFQPSRALGRFLIYVDIFCPHGSNVGRATGSIIITENDQLQALRCAFNAPYSVATDWKKIKNDY